MLHYKLSVRRVDKKDFSRDCPFPSISDDEYATRLIHFVDELKFVDGVEKVRLIEDGSIDIWAKVTVETFKDNAEYLFSHFFCTLRFEDLQKIP